jgi:carboxyl-terminal processing protease
LLCDISIGNNDSVAAFLPTTKTLSRLRQNLFLPASQNNVYDAVNHCIKQKLGTLLASAALATSLLTTPLHINIQINHPHPTISISSSKAYAFLTENQQLISEVWSTVTSTYFDPSFNGLGMEGWKSAELNAIQSVQDTGPEDEEIVNSAITTMLSKLNDPYTRFLPRDKYETLTAYATGTSVGGGGIGIQLLEDVRSMNVMVMAVTENGPAAKAGLQIGDLIVSIDGETMEGASAEVVAAKCRGEVGQKLEMDFLRTSDNGKSVSQHVSLSRAKIVQNPVRATTFETGNKKIGLLRIPSFSTDTVSQMVEGLRSISDSKVDAIVIDLRGNVGGYMPAGVDAAKLFLSPQSKIITEVDKTGTSKVYSADGIGSETSVPLYILVDKRTASASEIFVAGLQDNKRAVIVGTSNTFGKGRIQNVKALENGSGMAVTRARYVTPLGRDIHGVGITPDKTPNQCEANDSAKICLADVLDL